MLAVDPQLESPSGFELDTRTQAILRESEARFQKLFEEIPSIPVQGYDRNRRVIFWNRASEKVYGYSAAEALGQRIEDLIIPGAMREAVIQMVDSWIAGGPSIPPGEIYLRHKDGREVPVFSSHVVLENTLGQREMYCVDLDLTESKRTERVIRESEEKYRSIFENITQGLFQLSPQGHYLSVNPFFVQLLGYDSEAALRETLTDIEHQLYVDAEHYQQLQAQLQATGSIEGVESQIYRRNGHKIWVSETWRRVLDEEGNLLYDEGRLEDISLRRQAVEQLRYNAIHDNLTGLFNRSYLEQQLQQTLQSQRRGDIELFALLFIDLNRFKVINDSLGHTVGDKVLNIVAKRFRHVLRQDDVLARFGGDEFAVLLSEIPHLETAQQVAERLSHTLERPIHVDNEVFTVGASIGIALGNLNYSDASQILRDADIAMYRAKRGERESVVCFEQEMHPHVLARLQLETDLKRAIQQQEFQLYYQPIMDLVQNRLSGFEALLRWQHPQRGWVSPAEFIPVAEETRLIEPLSWWVFEAAITQLQQWRSQFPQAEHLTLNVNLSAVQLRQSGLAEQMQLLLQKIGLPGDRLKLEITESNFLEASDSNLHVFEEFKASGIGLCIDDFGTGYSSLSRLHQLPLDVLKIDRSFVDGLEQDSKKEAIAQSIVLLAHGLGARVVAEGIETEAQRQALAQMGCEFGQGYWFSRPVPPESAIPFIEKMAAV